MKIDPSAAAWALASRGRRVRVKRWQPTLLRSVARDKERPDRRVRTSRTEPTEAAAHARKSERARFAASVDVELRLACRSEADARRELGRAAHALLASSGHHRLGFAHLTDYARERLGVSARTLQAAAWLAGRLEALPLVGSAFDRGELSWAQARAVCAVADHTSEREWLARAQRSSASVLEALARSARPAGERSPDPDADDGTIDDEPAARLRLPCPVRIRALWRRALALASRAAGESLPRWRAAEIVAAEAFAGRPAGASFGDRAVLVALRLARRARRQARATPEPAPTVVSTSAPPDTALNVAAGAPPAFAGSAAMAAARQDPFALDARLADAMRVIQTSEPRIGRLLRVFVNHHLHRALGFPSVDAYVRDRLGISTRKAWALLKVERAAYRAGAFAVSYQAGRLSWVRALTILPVLQRENAEAWVERATSVTVRRLADEVAWVLDARDALGPHVPLDPPPVDAELGECHTLSPATALQIGAPGSSEAARLEVVDADVGFVGPASVVAFFRDTLDAHARPGEPRWTALERVLRHVIAYWESTPRHRDPVFARDGWRCRVPACSARRNLHDHHVQFRSRGGANGRDNRITICASHHLHGIHGGVIEAWGTAPERIHWRLGVRPGAPPLLSYVGDRICPPA